MTGSELDGRDSLASSADGVLGVHSAIDEEIPEASEGERQENEPLRIEAPPQPPYILDEAKRQFAPPSDSGLGTDLPTAALTDSEYFKSQL